jgi:hypothetical protein
LKELKIALITLILAKTATQQHGVNRCLILAQYLYQLSLVVLSQEDLFSRKEARLCVVLAQLLVYNRALIEAELFILILFVLFQIGLEIVVFEAANLQIAKSQRGKFELLFVGDLNHRVDLIAVVVLEILNDLD